MSSISSSSNNNLYALVAQQQTYGQKSNTGLQDRGTTSERVQAIKQVQESIAQNHGFDARQAQKDALTNNTKIVNTPAAQRGTLINITV